MLKAMVQQARLKHKYMFYVICGELENKRLEMTKKFSQAFYQTVRGQNVWYGTFS